ncbi:hypothetical protein SNE40_023662 [Patella caerulea]|uniref:Uncharacterized protein n=1 Tax=Patella caerulea TaxID=87958 RepID=A0AAN8G4T0_PATCE
MQLEIFHQHCGHGGGWVLYFDATEEVIGKLSDHPKRIYYYPLLIKPLGEPPIPVAEKITYSHRTVDIAPFFLTLRRDKNYLHLKSPNPSRIEIDFSWPFIHSAWNNETLEDYLCKAYNCIINEEIWDSKTKIHICSAHILHKLSSNVGNLCKDTGLTKFIL